MRVICIADQAMVRTGLACIVRDQLGLAMVAEGSTAEAGGLLAAHRPDVVVFVAREQEHAALQAVRTLTASSPETALLLLTPSGARAWHQRALEFGARGVITLEQPAATLVAAIQKLYQGELWYESGINGERRRGGGDPEEAAFATLTKREFEIVGLICEGLRNVQIAERLAISPTTVRNHVTSILDKLGLTDRFDLAVYSFRRGLVSYR